MERVLLFPGCVYRSYLPHLVQRYLSLLTSVGVSLVLFDDPMCCGYIFRDLGRKDIFKSNGLKLVKKIEHFSPDMIVNLCPTCNRHFEKHLKRDCGLNPEIAVCHVSKFLLGYKGIKGTQHLKNNVIGYQDPCWLGRRTGDYDSPRQVMRRLRYNLRNGQESRQFAQCCGYSGLIPVYHPDVSRAIGMKRMSYFANLGVNHVVTSCPRCYLGLTAVEMANVKVLDFAELFNLDMLK